MINNTCPIEAQVEPFVKELAALLNKYGEDTNCSTPDFILAEYLFSCLNSYQFAVEETKKWKTPHDQGISR